MSSEIFFDITMADSVIPPLTKGQMKNTKTSWRAD